jgi:hypothetical protein
MKVRFRHFEFQPVFRRPVKHALRVTLGLTDTEHYAIARLGNGNDPLFRYEIEDIEHAVSITDCVAGVRLDFDTLLQANEAQNQILHALEILEVILRQDSRGHRVETFKIPHEEEYGPERNHGTHPRPRAKARGNRRRAARHPRHHNDRPQGV